MSVGNNLVSVDFDEILRAIKEANADLSRRHERSLARFGLVRPDRRLDTEDEIRKAMKFAKELDDTARECRAARLNDTKPIRTFLKRVEEFFKPMENGLRDACAKVEDMIADAARRRVAVSRMVSVEEMSGDPPLAENDDESEVITGDTSPPAVEITLAWHVEAVDRDTIDLEALRPFLTDHCLKFAANAHFKRHGANSLKGVRYIRKVKGIM